MGKINDKLNSFLKSRKFIHTVETTINSKYTDEEIASLKKIYGQDFNPDVKGQTVKKTEAVDELTSEELDLLLKLDAIENQDEIKDRLKDIKEKICEVRDLEAKSEKHLKTIKTIMVTFTVIIAISALITLIQYFRLASLLG